jgi:hypothetical protein
LRKGGKKAELVARLENPAAAAASMNTRTVGGVHATLRASCCGVPAPHSGLQMRLQGLAERTLVP